MKITDVQMRRAMDLLGLDGSELQSVSAEADRVVAERLLGEFKVLVKTRFRKAAMTLHPDRTGNDPAKTEDFKTLALVVQELEKIQLAPPRPRPTMVVVSIGGLNIRVGNVSGATVTTSTSYWRGYGF